MLWMQIYPILIYFVVFVDNINHISYSLLYTTHIQLIALLREVKYLEQQNCPERVIPESAGNVFQQNETYRKYLQNLDVTVALYNKVRETILDVEYPLIKKQLYDIDQELEKAISKLNWTSAGIAGYYWYFWIYLMILSLLFCCMQMHGSTLNLPVIWCVI